jgi:hypothetical protein
MELRVVVGELVIGQEITIVNHESIGDVRIVRLNRLIENSSTFLKDRLETRSASKRDSSWRRRISRLVNDRRRLHDSRAIDVAPGTIVVVLRHEIAKHVRSARVTAEIKIIT